MTRDQSLRAINAIRAAIIDFDRGKLDAGALDIIIRAEVWPQAITDEDVAWGCQEAQRLLKTEKSAGVSCIKSATATPENWRPVDR